MPSQVDLKQLAINRESNSPSASNTSGSNSPLQNNRRHLLTRYVLPMTLLLGFAALVAWSTRDLFFPPTLVTVVPVHSATTRVQPEGTVLFQAAGWIEPRPTAIRVAALASGIVEKLLVVEDQRVEANQPIAELIDTDATLLHQHALSELKLRQAELAQAHAELTAANARFETPVHLQEKLSAAQAALAKIEKELNNLPFELRRAKAEHNVAQQDHNAKQAAKEAIAGKELYIAEGRLATATASVEELQRRSGSLVKEREALRAQTKALSTKLKLLIDETEAKKLAEAKVQLANARVDQAQIQVSQAKLKLDRMTVRSPVAGRVYHLVAQPGTKIGTSSSSSYDHDGSTVVSLYQPNKLQVRVDVRFADLPKVSVGQAVEINNPAIEKPIAGRVLFISSQADIQKNTIEVKVEILDSPDILKPEMLVDTKFLAPEVIEDPEAESEKQQSQQLAIFLPKQLIQQDQQGAFVWVADQSDGVARKTTIELDSKQLQNTKPHDLVQIISGLHSSSRIIVDGMKSLADGSRIKIAAEDPNIGQDLQ